MTTGGATVDVIAPRVLILPDVANHPAPTATGEIGMSGQTIYIGSGSTWMQISGANGVMFPL